jgi:PKD repeat protein
MRNFTLVLLKRVLLSTTLLIFATCQEKEPPPLPIASFEFSPQEKLIAPVEISFKNTSQNANSYTWVTSDGESIEATDVVLTVRSATTITVTLTATGEGGSDSFSKTISVAENPAANEDLPVADFSYSPAEITLEDNVFFTNNSINAVSFAWDFSDGTTSSERSPIKKFSEPGNYTVKLKATGNKGTTSEVSKNIAVTEYSAKVSFFTRTDFDAGKITVGMVNGPMASAQITKVYSNGISCEQNDVWMKTGPKSFQWYAESEKGFKWAGTEQLVAGKCHPIELTRYNMINGIVTFWTKSDLKVGKIKVAVNGIDQGSITQYHTQGINCGYGNVNVKLSGGTYKFKAVADDGTTWEDNITVDNGVCKSQELTKNVPSEPECDWNTYSNANFLSVEQKWGFCEADGVSVRITNKANIQLEIFGAIEKIGGKWDVFAFAIDPGKNNTYWSCKNTGKVKVWAMSKISFQKNNCSYPKP